MTIRYVGAGGSDANNGLSWATRKVTLNGCEDSPVAAGDIVYVGPGTYRETLTVDISGTAGNPITYIGDYTGANTDGVGGVVRISGSDNDQTVTRANNIAASGKNYRTFQTISFDLTSGNNINTTTGCTNWTIDKCTFVVANADGILFSGTTSAMTVSNCLFMGSYVGGVGVEFNHSSTTTSTGSVIQNCLSIGGYGFLWDVRVAGITIKNCDCLFQRGNVINIATALAGGSSITVNNCIFQGCVSPLVATVTGEIVEDYNSFFNNGTNRANTATGTHSNAFPALFDPRWFFELVTNTAGPGSVTQIISPFDLSSFSQLLNVAGTSPTATDMRGTAVQGAQREWGALEYDSTLKIESAAAGGGVATPMFGGGVVQ